MDPNFRFRPAGLLIAVVALVLAFGAGSTSADIFIVDCDTTSSGWTHNTISAAVAAAEVGCTGEDTIVVRPCVYNENVFISSCAAGLHIIAAEEEDTEVVGARPAGVGAGPSTPRPMVNGSGGGHCFTVDAERVSIQGLELGNCGGDGVYAAPNAKLLRVHDMLIHGLGGSGIQVEGADAPTLTSNWIWQVSDHGIHLDTVTDAFVADNVIRGTSVPGGSGVLIDGTNEDVQVLNNEVYSAWGPGIHVAGGTRARIERNTALGNCWGMPSPPFTLCDCDQILVSIPASYADVAGNDADSPPLPGISLCVPATLVAEEGENDG